MAPFAASNARQPSLGAGGDSSTTQLSSSPMPLAMPASNKRTAPPSMLPPLQPQSQAQQQQQQQGGFNFGSFSSSGGGAQQQQGQGVPSASPFFGGGGGGDAGLTTPAASTSSTGGAAAGSVDYFAVPTRVAAAAKEAPPPTPGGLSAATPGGEPHPWAALFAQGNGPSTIGMGGGGGSITPLVGDHSAFAAAAAGTSDGGTTPTLRFPSALAGAGMGRSFSGGLSGHGVRNASQASSTFSAGSEGDASRFTPLDSHHLAMLLSHNNNNASSSSASSSSSTHANGIEAGTWNHPRLRRASRSSSPGGSSSSSSGGATSSSQDDASEGSTLVLDIRPSTSFGAARIRKSVNVCAPSTLLKRPGMTVQRIEEEMLGSRTDARRFARWKNGVRGAARTARQNSHGSNGAGESALDTSGGASSAATSDEEREEAGPRVQRIVVLDTDTRRVGDAGRSNAGGGGACLIGLLRKFEAAGFEGELCWLVGGFNGFARTTDASKDIDAEKLIDRKPVRTEKDKQTGTGTGAGAGAAKAPPKADPPTHSGQIPKLSDLGRAESTRRSSAPSNLPPPDMQGLHEQQQRRDDAAAAAASGGAAGRRRDLVQPRALPAEAFTSSSLADWGPAGQSRTRGMIGSVSQPQGLDVPMSANACANPFFDNIRQNRELAHGVTERIPLDIPTLTSAQRSSLPSFLARLVDAAPEARADELAQAFYDIERDEQRRLMLTMRQHASESSVDPRRSGGGAAPADDAGARGTAPQLSSRFCALGAEPRHAVPFSIAAALERGAENRYNNIWTYEHSRVKLHTPPPGACDYLNASFVEPAREHGALRRYIATQAPLPSTFEAFWTAVWEQRCACIAMLTREHESGRIQSHMYWGDGAYGKRLTLRLVHEESLDEKGDVVDAPVGKAPGADDGGGNLFPSMSGGDAKDGRSENEACIIVRTFELSMVETREKRTVTQLQYVAWPDYHIPDSPEALLTYMDLAAALQQAADDELRAASPNAASATGEESLVGPMVVHCSAGVGRTGTYVVIDSVLDVLRRRRAAARAEATPKCWDNGAGISIANGVIQHRGRAKANAAQRDVRMHSPGAAPASSSSSSSFFGAGAMGRFEGFKLDKVAVARTPRKSLKRELSPSAMDLDAPGEAAYQAAGSERKDMSSPPPMRRSRSDVDSSPDDDAAGGSAGPTGRQNSLTGLTSAVTQMGKAVASSTGMQRSGSETPSKAMGGLRIAWDSTGSSSPQQPSTPTPGAAASPFAAAIAQGPQPALVLRSPKVAGSGEDDTTMKTNEVSPRSALSPLPPSALAFESGTKQNNSSNAGGAGGENVDWIRGAVEVTREQRMSSVQTTRQYVFVYAAVLQGVLREVAREQE